MTNNICSGAGVRLGLTKFYSLFPTMASLVLLGLTFTPSTVQADRYLWNTILTGTHIVHNASSLNKGAGTSVAVIDGLEVVVFQPRFYSLSDNGVILLSDEVVV